MTAGNDLPLEALECVPLELLGFRTWEALPGSPRTPIGRGLETTTTEEAGLAWSWSLVLPANRAIPGEPLLPLLLTAVIDPRQVLEECERCFEQQRRRARPLLQRGRRGRRGRQRWQRPRRGRRPRDPHPWRRRRRRLVDLADAVAVLEHLWKGGEAKACLDAAGVDGGGVVNLADVAQLLGALCSGGPPPATPHPESGDDPTPVDLSVCVATSRP